MIRVSVALAAYNGEKYIEQQVQSILDQLSDNDELVISYNQSSDNTLRIINDYEKKYSNVHVVHCNKKGVISNFENALKHCKGEYVFLSDQDDVWIERKIKTVLQEFDSDTILVQHDAQFVDGKLNAIDKTLFSYRGNKSDVRSNIIKNCYQGCCMAFKRELLEIALPIPREVPMHDQWLGIIAAHIGKVKMINDLLILYRMHGENASVSGLPLIKKIVTRVVLLREYEKRRRRFRR